MRTFALIFGIIFLISGVAGFGTAKISNEYIHKIFKFNMILNSLHLTSGIIAICVACLNRRASLLFFKIIGTCYAILAVLGFLYGEDEILGIFASNPSNTWFHMIIAIAALVLGYSGRDYLKLG